MDAATFLDSDIVSEQIGGKNIFLHPDIADKVKAADAEMRAATGKGLEITSSYRSNQQQRDAYRRYQSGQGGLAAKPGMSRHERGLAVDVGNYKEAGQYLRKQGLVDPFVSKGDPVHFQLGDKPKATPFSAAKNMVAGDNAVPVDDDKDLQAKAAAFLDSPDDKDLQAKAAAFLDSPEGEKPTSQNINQLLPPHPVEGAERPPLDSFHKQKNVDLTMGLDKPVEVRPASNAFERAGEITNRTAEGAVKAGYGLLNAPVQTVKEIVDGVLSANYDPNKSFIENLGDLRDKVTNPAGDMGAGVIKGIARTTGALTGQNEDFRRDPGGTLVNAALIGKGLKEPFKAESEKPLETPKDELNQRLSAVVKPALDRALKTSSGKIRGYADLEKFDQSEVDAIRFLTENKGQLVNSEGVKGALPKNLKEHTAAIWQGKKLQWDKIDARRKAAGEAGVRVPTSELADELEAFAADPVMKINAKTAVNHALELARDYREQSFLTPEQAQSSIKTLNAKLDSYYSAGHSTYAEPSVAGVDALAVNKLRRLTDREFTKATGEGWQEERNLYGSLTKLEETSAKRAFKEAQKNEKGLIDFSDMYTAGELIKGIATGDPVSMAKAAGVYGTKRFIKWRNDPNRLIKNMYQNVDSALEIAKRQPNPRDALPVTPKEPTEQQKLLPPPAIKLDTSSDTHFNPRGPGTRPPGGGTPDLRIRPDAQDVGRRPDTLFDVAGARPDFERRQGPVAPAGQAGNLPLRKPGAAPDLRTPGEPGNVGKPPELINIAGARPDYTRPQTPVAPPGQANVPRLTQLAAPRPEPLKVTPMEHMAQEVPEAQRIMEAAKGAKRPDNVIPIEGPARKPGELPSDRAYRSSGKLQDNYRNLFDEIMKNKPSGEIPPIKETAAGLTAEQLRAQEVQPGKTQAQVDAEQVEQMKRDIAERKAKQEGIKSQTIVDSQGNARIVRPKAATPKAEGDKDMAWKTGSEAMEKEPESKPESATKAGEGMSKAEVDALKRRNNARFVEPEAASKLSLKEQKATLLKSVDEALSEAKSNPELEDVNKQLQRIYGKKDAWRESEVQELEDKRDALLKEQGKITFNVGKSQYHINTDKASLEAFRRVIRTNFPTKEQVEAPKLPGYPNAEPLSSRIEGEGVSYYNEYQPRRATVDSTLRYSEKVRSAEIDQKIKGLHTVRDRKARDAKRRTLAEARQEPIAMLTADGFVSDNKFAIKPLTKPEGIEKSKQLLSERFTAGTSPVVESYETKGIETQHIPLVHFVAENGAETLINAKYADTIMTAYPKAKIELMETSGVQVPVFFDNGEMVGVVFSRMEGEEITNYIAEQRKIRKAEKRKEGNVYLPRERNDHKVAIEQALKEGKPVPAEVLKDYPELQSKSESAAKAVEGKASDYYTTRAMNVITRRPSFEDFAKDYPKKEDSDLLKAGGYTHVYFSPNRPASPVYDGSASARGNFIFSNKKLSMGELIDKELIPHSRTEQAELAIQHYKDLYGEKPLVFYKENDGRWQGAVINKSSKQAGSWQVTYFDKDGFSGDMQAKSQIDGAKEVLESGFKKFAPDALDRAMKLDSFHEGNAKTAEVAKENARIAQRLAKRETKDSYELPKGGNKKDVMKVIDRHIEVLKDYPELQPKSESAAKAVGGKAKQPHEMTLEKYRKSGLAGKSHNLDTYPQSVHEEYQHQQALMGAMAEGKEVSSAIIKNHPSLSSKPGWAMTQKEFLDREMYTAGMDGSEAPKIQSLERSDAIRRDAETKLYEAKLGWLVDKPGDASYLSKAKQKIWERYQKADDAYWKIDKETRDEQQLGLHKSAVENAINKGLPVPENVLAEYPGLARKAKLRKAEND